jgi:hypothetical protein
MDFLYQWYGKESCAYTHCLVNKQMSMRSAVMIDTVEWYLKTSQVSPV